MKVFLLSVLCLGVLCTYGLEETAPCDGCRPALDPHTQVEAVPGLRGSVEIIPDYGTCPVTYRNYTWFVSWGDGVSFTKATSALMPEQTLYTYAAPGIYNVEIAYCATPNSCCKNCVTANYTLNINQ